MVDSKRLHEEIERKYQSLEIPNYSFVNKATSSNPYEKLIEQLYDAFETEEITDLNDDVCFRYMLSKSGRQWIVELSMVGMYATVFRLSETNLPELTVLDEATSDERDIQLLLSNYGIDILEKSILEIPTSLKLNNTEPGGACLYQALFSDTDIVPWIG